MKLAIGTIATLVAAVTAACSNAQDRPVVQPTCAADPFPSPHGAVSPCKAPDVLAAAVTTIYDLDPIVGMDARSMFEAARPLLRAAFATEARVGVSMWAPITPVQWQDWVAHQVALSTEVHLSSDDHPPDTATSSSRVLAVTITPADQAPIVFAVYARATRQTSESAWLLADLRVL